MSQTILTTDLPAAIRLKPRFDAKRLQAELAELEHLEWPAEAPYRFEGFFGSETKVFHDGQWVGLSFRSQGGSAARTDPGGPALEEFQDTHLLTRAPYIGEVLRSLRGPLRSARLLRLPPGAAIGEHRDTYHGFEYGQIRLHVPITTNDGVENIIRGEACRWQPGELWYGDFGSPHSGRNGGNVDRVHLVVDVLLVPAVLELFPDEYIDRLSRVDVLYHERPVAVSEDQLKQFECDFDMPATLVRGIFDVDDGIQAQMKAEIRCRNRGLTLALEGRDVIRLIPLTNRRFAFAGWTMERYLQFAADDGPESPVTLVLRRGQRQTQLTFEARFEQRAEAHATSGSAMSV